jgi:hypothetical protein
MRICNGENPKHNRSLFGLKSPRRFFISLYGDALHIGQLLVALGPSDQRSRTLKGGTHILRLHKTLAGSKLSH